MVHIPHFLNIIAQDGAWAVAEAAWTAANYSLHAPASDTDRLVAYCQDAADAIIIAAIMAQTES